MSELKSKFIVATSNYKYDELVNESIKIADEHAIDFAKWCFEKGIYTQFKITQHINKKVLKAYKKEKGL